MPAPRKIVAVLALATLATSAAGCTSEDPPKTDPTPSVSVTSTPDTDVELKVAVYGDEARVQTYQRIADAFTETHPDIHVELVREDDAAEAAVQARTALEIGGGPDVFLTEQEYLPELVQSGGLEPLDRLLEARGLQFGDDYQRVAMTSMSAHSRLQCMPSEMSPRVVWFNKRLVPRRQLALQEIVVPNTKETSWSWSDFETTARTVAGLDQLGPVKGVYIPPDVGTITALVRSGGADIVDDTFDPHTLTLTDDDALEAIGQLVRLARDPAVSLTKQDLARRDALKWFTSGRLGMLVGTRDDLAALRAAKGLQFDVAPLPSLGRARSTAEVSGLCLNGGSSHLDAAADFIAYAVGPEAAEIMASTSTLVPARLDTLSQDVFRQPDQQPRHSEVFATSLRRSDPMPYDVGWPRVADLVQDAFARLFLGNGFEPDTELEPRLVKLEEHSQTVFSAED